MPRKRTPFPLEAAPSMREDIVLCIAVFTLPLSVQFKSQLPVTRVKGSNQIEDICIDHESCPHAESSPEVAYICKGLWSCYSSVTRFQHMKKPAIIDDDPPPLRIAGLVAQWAGDLLETRGAA